MSVLEEGVVPDDHVSRYPKAGKIITLLSTGLIVGATWAALAVLIWNLDRGLDLTDEAHLLYLYRHPDAFYLRGYWQYQILINAITPSFLDHILFYRTVKLLALAGTTVLFALALL